MSFGYNARFYMLDITGIVLAAVVSPLVGEAVCRWVAGQSKRENTEEKTKLRRKKKRSKSGTISFLFSTLMVALVVIMWVNILYRAQENMSLLTLSSSNLLVSLTLMIT